MTDLLCSDAALERKLSLYEALGRGLPQHLKLKLHILAVEEAAVETDHNYSKILEVLRSALTYAQGGAFSSEEVSAVLTALRNMDGVGDFSSGFLYVPSDRFSNITNELHINRLRVLRSMAGMGLLKLMAGDGPRFTYQRNVNGVKTRCVAIRWEEINYGCSDKSAKTLGTL